MAVSHKDYGLMCQAAADEREAIRRESKLNPTALADRPA